MCITRFESFLAEVIGFLDKRARAFAGVERGAIFCHGSEQSRGCFEQCGSKGFSGEVPFLDEACQVEDDHACARGFLWGF